MVVSSVQAPCWPGSLSYACFPRYYGQYSICGRSQPASFITIYTLHLAIFTISTAFVQPACLVTSFRGNHSKLCHMAAPPRSGVLCALVPQEPRRSRSLHTHTHTITHTHTSVIIWKALTLIFDTQRSQQMVAYGNYFYQHITLKLDIHILHEEFTFKLFSLIQLRIYFRADSRLAPSQWETALQSNAVSHWLGANLESALYWVNGRVLYRQAIAWTNDGITAALIGIIAGKYVNDRQVRKIGIYLSL